MTYHGQRERRQWTAGEVTCIGVALWCLLGACSDVPLTPLVDGSVGLDAGARLDAQPMVTPEPPAVPIPPAAPAPASLTPCPEGWREITPATPEDVVTCDPWPVDGPATCADDAAHFPGDAGCTIIGTPCTSGDWAQGLPGGVHTLYVLPGGGGDGSMSAPYGTIGAALAAASDGTIIALGKGVYDEVVTVQTGVTLWGACVADTVITASVASSSSGTINIEAANATLRNLRITGNRTGIQSMGSGYSVHVQDVLIEQARRFGMYINVEAEASANSLVIRGTRSTGGDTGQGLLVTNGARVQLTRAVLQENRTEGIEIGGANANLSLSDTVIRDTLPDPYDDYRGYGLRAWGGAHVDAEGLVVEGNRELGMFFSYSSTGTLTDVIVRGTLSSLGMRLLGDMGIGIAVGSESNVSVTRGLIAQNRRVGISVSGVGSHVEVQDSVVTGTRVVEAGAQAGDMGVGLGVWSGASATVRRVLVANGHDSNIFIGDSGSTAVLEDIVVHRGHPRTSDMRYGAGLSVARGARATVERALVAHHRHAGVIVTGDGSELYLADARVTGTRYQEANLEYGEGVLVYGSAHATLERVVLEDNDYAGIFSYNSNTRIDMTDVVVRDTNPSHLNETMGIGLLMLLGSTGQITRGLIENNHTAGIVVAGQDSYLMISDARVRDTQPRLADGDLGRGLYVSGGASVDGQRVVFEGNHDIGMMVLDDGSRINLEDVVVQGTKARMQDEKFGYGVGAYSSGVMELSRFAIADNAQLGLQIADDGAIKLFDGVVSGHTIAANVQDPDFDLACLQNNTQYIDNTIQWRGFVLPVPGTGF